MHACKMFLVVKHKCKYTLISFEKYYVYNIFITDHKWQIVTGEQKSNLSCEFKLEPITTYYL